MTTNRTPDAQLSAALRALDAAPSAPLDAVGRVRADAALERVLAEGRAPRTRTARRDPLVPRPRRTGVRVAALGVVAAAAVAGVGATQVLGGAPTAYADSWEPVPTAATEADVAAAHQACATSSGPLPGIDLAQMQPRLAERRGDLVLLVMDDGTADPQVLSCLVAVPRDGGVRWLATSGGGGARPPAGAVTPPGLFMQSTPGDELSVVDGLVGDGVRGVTVRTGGGLVVEATVTNGHYAAWWPGLAMRTTSEPYPSGESGGCAPDCDGTRLVDDFTIDVTLDDGTVVLSPAPGS